MAKALSYEQINKQLNTSAVREMLWEMAFDPLEGGIGSDYEYEEFPEGIIRITHNFIMCEDAAAELGLTDDDYDQDALWPDEPWKPKPATRPPA